MKFKVQLSKRVFVFAWLASSLALQVCFAPANSANDRSRTLQSPGAGRSINAPARNNAITKKASCAYGELPLSFETNHGQADSQVRFLSRGNSSNLYLTPNEVVMEFPGTRPPSTSARTEPAGIEPQSSVVRMKLVAANSSATSVSSEELPARINYFTGSDSKKWRLNIPTYARVRFESVYPGVDVVYYGNQRRLEYDFYVAPGAAFKAIRLRFEGPRRMQIAPNGDLVLEDRFGEIRQPKPVVYQEEQAGRREIAGRYLLKGNREIGFDIGAHDQNKPLIIDPILTYATYLADRHPKRRMPSRWTRRATLTWPALRWAGSPGQAEASAIEDRVLLLPS